MNINELKVGDRVKCKICFLKEEEAIGDLIDIKDDKFYVKFGLRGVFYFNRDGIISKLEPLSQYKEIKIEHENLSQGSEQDCRQRYFASEYKNSIKISDLKVGDKIRYRGDLGDSFVVEFLGLDTIDVKQAKVISDYKNSESYYIWADKIICKLEPIRSDNRELREKINTKLNQITSTISSFRAAELSSEILELTKEMYNIRYEEIPIEKEIPQYWTNIARTQSYSWISQENVGKRVRGNYEHDPGSYKKEGIITKAFPPSPGTIGDCTVYYEVKQDNGEFFNVKSFWVEFIKEKPAPKSFKFEFIVNTSPEGAYTYADNPFYGGKGKFLRGLTNYYGTYWGQVKIPFPKEWEEIDGKTYTIEIKEKE